jgi:hypothetical protein
VLTRALSALLLAYVLLAGGAAPVHAQEPAKKLSELSLEELMAVNIISLNVLGTHTHLAGQWMVSYEFMNMRMNGNRDGTARVSNQTVLDQFEVSPTDMTVQMHMPAVMYAPTNDLTLMAMLPLTRKSMNHIMRDGGAFSEESSGTGDLSLTALYTFFEAPEFRHRFLLNVSVSLPTGSINRTMDNLRMEYPMQLGSGSFEIAPGVTYLGQTRNWAVGAEAIPRLRLGENANGYRLGNQYRLSAWLARRLTEGLSASARIEGEVLQNIHGVDAALDPEDEPTKDVNIQGGKRLGVSIGLNLFAPTGPLRGHRLSVEGTLPLYQSLDGPQLETDWQLRIAWQWIFSGFGSTGKPKSSGGSR